MKIERLYSNYQEEERLYSTGNEELDDLLERAFCEGYEYAQREFGKIGSFLNQAGRNNQARLLKNLRNGKGTVYNSDLFGTTKRVNAKNLSPSERRDAARRAAQTSNVMYPKGSNQFKPISNIIKKYY